MYVQDALCRVLQRLIQPEYSVALNTPLVTLGQHIIAILNAYRRLAPDDRGVSNSSSGSGGGGVVLAPVIACVVALLRLERTQEMGSGRAPKRIKSQATDAPATADPEPPSLPPSAEVDSLATEKPSALFRAHARTARHFLVSTVLCRGFLQAWGVCPHEALDAIAMALESAGKVPSLVFVCCCRDQE